jgi:predicted transposase YbfD/YdcC
MVSAWANSNRLVLGQLAVEGKSNEIKAVPALLKLLDVRGCIVTADALNCQKEIASQIIDQKGDYLLALKGNHRHLFEDVVSHFDWALGRAAKGVEMQTLFSSYSETTNLGHGRSGKRRCWCVDLKEIGGWDKVLDEWPDLRTLVLIESQRSLSQNVPEAGAGTSGMTAVWSPPSLERRYYLTSLESNAEKILGAVREHWGIENSLHWVLDVVFNEDASRIRKDHAPKNMTILRHLALNLLRLNTSHKGGLKSKRLRAGWDNDFLKALLVGEYS